MSLPSRKPVNYLNNKDILKEIHEGKTTYCHFSKPKYHRYDFIVDMPQPKFAVIAMCSPYCKR